MLAGRGDLRGNRVEHPLVVGAAEGRIERELQQEVGAVGDAVAPAVARVEAAVASYPYPASYRTWPGPNSNTFTAWVGRNVPELRLKRQALRDVDPVAMHHLAGGHGMKRPAQRPPRRVESICAIGYGATYIDFSG